MPRRTIPTVVKDAAQGLIELCNGKIAYLGQYNDSEVYCYKPIEDIEIGFPTIYLYKDGEVVEISDFLALDIIHTVISKRSRK